MDLSGYLLRLEKNLILGSGRWVADFTESFRQFPVQSERFDMFLRGGTRPTGFLLSKIFAFLTMPDYRVAFFVKTVSNSKININSLLETIQGYSAVHNTRWNWLALVSENGFAESLVRRVGKIDTPDVGIGLVSLKEGSIDTSRNLLGEKAMSLLNCFRVSG